VAVGVQGVTPATTAVLGSLPGVARASGQAFRHQETPCTADRGEKTCTFAVLPGGKRVRREGNPAFSRFPPSDSPRKVRQIRRVCRLFWETPRAPPSRQKSFRKDPADVADVAGTFFLRSPQGVPWFFQRAERKPATTKPRIQLSSSSNALASIRSAVSKPSVNQPYTGASRS
jgi:hypothetical protein